MVGNVTFGANSYVAAGSYSNAWNFGTRSGAVTGTFDGLGISGTTALINNGPGFSVSGLSVSDLCSANISGAFFSTSNTASGANGAIGQAGNFSITGTRNPVGSSGPAVNYTSGCTFAAQR